MGESNKDHPNYTTVYDKDNRHVYNRSNNSGDDNGRCTASDHDYSHPDNIKIVDNKFLKKTDI